MNYEEVFTVHVNIMKTIELKNDDGDSVVMISFSGDVSGRYFYGVVLDGGIDTQVIRNYGDRHTLSARYMLEGKDHTGEACRIYIENNGDLHKQRKDGSFRTFPMMVTNSKALSFLNHELFVGEGVQTESGVDIIIYRWI
ncbi:DUF3237 family protein [Paenibacillus endoradicis]|uniref:DUF3237 family protein n=1 Tax=Paenibacillus endoradicis TaxID=2972487 RepID=UPI002158ACD9|nr:DUF3237 family protein [Paenibacillus endoradicis]MCR8655915.1 DUF3237 family protein [Paenibacillus endoradicis]MCR8658241.1 DUF3237 family protein [Paenibacillus endoradicis]